MTIPQLAPDEPLSPELVLVLPPERRAQVLATLELPVWPAPKLRVVTRPAPAAEPVDLAEESLGRALGRFLAARVVQLSVIFAAATILTVALSLVAHALH
jgi:hypothetical protein